MMRANRFKVGVVALALFPANVAAQTGLQPLESKHQVSSPMAVQALVTEHAGSTDEASRHATAGFSPQRNPDRGSEITASRIRRLGGFALALTLAPGGALADKTQSFEKIERAMTTDKTVVVVEQNAKGILTARNIAEDWPATNSGVTTTRIDVSSARAQAVERPRSSYTAYLRPEVFISYGRAKYVWHRWSPSAWANIGAGMALRLSDRTGVEFELNRMLRVSPGSVSGFAFIPSRPGSAVTITAREGFTSMTMASGSFLYYFSDRRIQPFASVGVGLAWERGLVALPGTVTPINEKEFHDIRRPAVLGGGIRVAITRRVAVRPEVKLYTTGVSRASFAAAYQW